jgi:hypothetical protein
MMGLVVRTTTTVRNSESLTVRHNCVGYPNKRDGSSNMLVVVVVVVVIEANGESRLIFL